MKKTSEITHRIIDNKSLDYLDEIGVLWTRMSLAPFNSNGVVLAVASGTERAASGLALSGDVPDCERPAWGCSTAGNNSSKRAAEITARIKALEAGNDIANEASAVAKGIRHASQSKATLGGTWEQAIRKAILDMVDGFGFAVPKQVSLAYHLSQAWTPAKINRLLRPARRLLPPRPRQPAAGIYLPTQSEMLLWLFDGFNFCAQDGVVRDQGTTRETSNSHL